MLGKTLVTLLVVSWSVVPGARADAFGESAVTIRYGDVFKLALRTAPQLERAGFDVTRADATVLSASAAEDWTLTLSGKLERTRVLSATLQPNDSISASIGISRLLPTNGT